MKHKQKAKQQKITLDANSKNENLHDKSFFLFSKKMLHHTKVQH